MFLKLKPAVVTNDVDDGDDASRSFPNYYWKILVER